MARSPEVVGTPLSYGRSALARALGAAHSDANVRLALAGDPVAATALAGASIVLDARPDSYAIVPDAGGTLVVGRDETGAMYGALDLVERLETQGASALPPAAPIAAAPEVPIRGANLFVSLPEAGEARWWFLEDAFWQEYLDLLARARMNFLDLQAMHDLHTARFPNALLYLATSRTYPDTGAPPAERARNARMLRRIVALAGERGIRVGLLTNRADDSLRAVDQEQGLDDDALRVYTREAVADLAAQVPELRRLGFRIGESRRPAAWFGDAFIAGVRDASRTMGVYTRTWLTDKAEILPLARRSGDLLIEAKYNGEQIGPPYVMAGGLFGQRWTRYSYADYLDPPSPYTFIFQIWGGGTHRLFRHASFERIRRTVGETLLGPSQGFTLLATHAFLPQRDFYHATAADRFSPWSFRRDEVEYLLFGRLAYDPRTPEAVFREALRRRAGTDALWGPVQAASEIVPWIQTAHTCGPDQRNFAPDLEWGGTVGMWASAPDASNGDHTCNTGYHGAYDTFAVASPYDTARGLLDGRGTTRLPSTEVARLVLAAAGRAREAAGVAIDAGNAEARDVVRECVALADLGDYFGHKLRAATALAVHRGSGRADYLDEARKGTRAADEAWRALGRDTAYIRPFAEPMRMAGLGMPTYHWSMQRTDGDPASIDAVAARRIPVRAASALPPAPAWLAGARPAGPGLASLIAAPPARGDTAWRVTATFARPVPDGAEVRVLWKPFSGLADWQSAPATGSDRTYRAAIDGAGEAIDVAVEVGGGPGFGWRYPDLLGAPPYATVASSGNVAGARAFP